MTYTLPTVYNASICGYLAYSSDDICFEKSYGECLCLVQESCCMCRDVSLGTGCETNDQNNECCAIACHCYRCALKKPEFLFASVSRSCGWVTVASFPFDSRYVGEPICAFCYLSCAPECGCAKLAPYSSKLDSLYASVTSPASQAIKR